jgi:hypothetical protein
MIKMPNRQQSLWAPYLSVLLLLTRAQVSAGPPFKTDDPQPVDYLHWEFYVASEQQFARQATEATCPHFEVNYGVVPNMQLHLVAPLGYAHSDAGTHYGYSDTELGVKYRFVEETETAPQVGVFPMVEIPTGDKNKQLGSGEVQVYIPVWLQKRWGNLTTYGGAGYWYNPGPQQRNWVFAGWELQYDFSKMLTLGGEAYYHTADAQDSDAGGEFNIGGFINLSENNHILFSLGRSVSGAATITGYIGYQLTI